MGMNRRNVLIGLGAVTAGGGAVFASGAFSTVEADRTVSIDVVGDANALLGLDVNSGQYNGISGAGTGNAIEIQTSSLNDDATTRFDQVLTVTNNGNKEVDLDITSIDAGITFYNENGNDLETDSVAIAADTSHNLDLEIDTSILSDEATPSVTFRATT